MSKRKSAAASFINSNYIILVYIMTIYKLELHLKILSHCLLVDSSVDDRRNCTDMRMKIHVHFVRMYFVIFTLRVNA